MARASHVYTSALAIAEMACVVHETWTNDRHLLAAAAHFGLKGAPFARIHDPAEEPAGSRGSYSERRGKIHA